MVCYARDGMMEGRMMLGRREMNEWSRDELLCSWNSQF
jgi:hypothetical protein